MDLQVGVKILLKNREGKYLFLRRSKEKYAEIGAQWDIVGGRIDPGVPLLENLKREIKEETNLEMLNDPVLISAQDILKTDKHVVRLTYIGEATGEVMLSDEHDEYQWFTIDEVKILPDFDRYVKEILVKL